MGFIQRSEFGGRRIVRLDVVVRQVTCQNSSDCGVLVELMLYITFHHNVGLPSSPKEFGGSKLRVLLIVNVPCNDSLRMYFFKDAAHAYRCHLPSFTLAMSTVFPLMVVIRYEITQLRYEALGLVKTLLCNLFCFRETSQNRINSSF